jgi:hypothetical protein
MNSAELLFQYCPKFILFSKDWKSVFLAKRKGEMDYDGTFSFIGALVAKCKRQTAVYRLRWAAKKMKK